MDQVPILTVLTVIPIVGAIVLFVVRPPSLRSSRAMALTIGGVWLLLVGVLFFQFDRASGGAQFVERQSWAEGIGIEYHLAADGLSLTMLLLVAIVTLIAIAISDIHERSWLYFGLVLLLQAGLCGTFTALNFFHWFLFWELSLVPAFFLIRLWGGVQRAQAAMQFFIFTMVGSIGMLLGFLLLYRATGTFDFETLGVLAREGILSSELSRSEKWGGVTPWVVFWGIFLGLAVKVPIVPFHIWLPGAYGEATTGTTALLTGAMSKMGVYGFLRIFFPLFPNAGGVAMNILLALAVISILYSAFAALNQTDLKRIFAYLSVSHLGYCVLGVFAAMKGLDAAGQDPFSRAAALDGVVLQMFSHGLTAATLFGYVAFLERRHGGRCRVDQFGGLRAVAPVFCGFMGIAIFSSLGLPGLNGFPGEFLIFAGALHSSPWAVAFSLAGVLLTAVFLLAVFQKLFWGPLAESGHGFRDLGGAERMVMVPATGLMLLTGIYPQWIIGVFERTVAGWLP